MPDGHFIVKMGEVVLFTREDVALVFELIGAAADLVTSAVPGELRGVGQEVFLVGREQLQRLYQAASVATCSNPDCESCREMREKFAKIGMELGADDRTH